MPGHTCQLALVAYAIRCAPPSFTPDQASRFRLQNLAQASFSPSTLTRAERFDRNGFLLLLRYC